MNPQEISAERGFSPKVMKKPCSTQLNTSTDQKNGVVASTNSDWDEFWETWSARELIGINHHHFPNLMRLKTAPQISRGETKNTSLTIYIYIINMSVYKYASIYCNYIYKVYFIYMSKCFFPDWLKALFCHHQATFHHLSWRRLFRSFYLFFSSHLTYQPTSIHLPGAFASSVWNRQSSQDCSSRNGLLQTSRFFVAHRKRKKTSWTFCEHFLDFGCWRSSTGCSNVSNPFGFCGMSIKTWYIPSSIRIFPDAWCFF